MAWLVPWVSDGVRHVLGLALAPRSARPGEVLALLAHNLPAVAWPLLLPLLPLRTDSARTAASAFVLAALAVNTGVVGLAFGAYGPRLLAWLPHVPLEWAALALPASTWLTQRNESPRAAVLLRSAVLVAMLLLGAAVLETYAVPHS